MQGLYRGIGPTGLALCTEHAGDGFYRYVPVLESDREWLGEPGQGFGDYAAGELEQKLDSRSFHLLAAGEKIEALELQKP